MISPKDQMDRYVYTGQAMPDQARRKQAGGDY